MSDNTKLIDLVEYQTCYTDIDLNKINLDYFSYSYQNSKLLLKAKQFVGVAQFGDLRISVYPKLFPQVSEVQKITLHQKKQSLSNFLFMMQYAYKIHNIKDFETSSDTDKFDFLEVLIYIFAKNLMNLLKVNLNRSYVIVEDDSNFLKGSWRLSEQLSRMPHIKHRFLVSYDEFTENNPLNRILKFVSFMLLRFSRNSSTQTILQNILLIYAEVDDISKPGHTYLEQVKFNRMNQEFKSIFEFAKMFLNKLVGEYSKTKDTNFSFMFDMNVLFEQFIAGFIESENLIPKDRYMKTQARSEYLATFKKDDKVEKNENVFMLKPDISFWIDNKCELIIDTKYKLLDDKDEKKYGVGQSDAYQMYAYAMKYKCERVILLYPQHLEGTPINKNYDFDGEKKLQIRTVDICIDLRNHKDKLKEEMIIILNHIYGDEYGKN